MKKKGKRDWEKKGLLGQLGSAKDPQDRA